MSKVKVVNCTNPNHWYNEKVGSTLTVFQSEYKKDYFVVNQSKVNGELSESYFLLKEDCRVLDLH